MTDSCAESLIVKPRTMVACLGCRGAGGWFAKDRNVLIRSTPNSDLHSTPAPSTAATQCLSWFRLKLPCSFLLLFPFLFLLASSGSDPVSIGLLVRGIGQKHSRPRCRILSLNPFSMNINHEFPIPLPTVPQLGQINTKVKDSDGLANPA